MEPCQSGLTYLFAKEAGCKSPREFESPRLRKKKKNPFRFSFLEKPSEKTALLTWVIRKIFNYQLC